MTLLWPDDRWGLSVHGVQEGTGHDTCSPWCRIRCPVRTEVPRQEGTLFLL